MLKFVAMTGALVLAIPALAQTTLSTLPASTGGMQSAPAPAGSTSSSQAAPMQDQSTAPTATDAASIIAAEFPTYDKDTSGSLSKAEFDAWMTTMRSKTGEAESDPAKQAEWLKGAFTTADADKNKSVSQAELTSFLTAKG